jgi:uncharacterized membrane protein YoaK (UPF0700 family)
MFLSLYLRLTDKDRYPQANFYLGCVMALIAGAINAGGFLAVRRYTSHMTGIISGMADDFILSDFTIVLTGFAALLSFVAGAEPLRYLLIGHGAVGCTANMHCP